MTTQPEFDAKRVSGTQLRAAIERSGAAVIRGCFAADRIAELWTRALSAYRIWQTHWERGELDGDSRRHFEFGHIVLSNLDRPGEHGTVFTLIMQSALQQILATLWNGNIAFLSSNCFPRRQVPGPAPNRPVPFHQDAIFLGNPGLILNFWIPLVPCGITAPGLEVVLDHPGEILTPKGGAELLNTDYSGIELSYDEVVRRWGKDKLWHPALDRGDVMVFSHLTVHRTYQTADMTQPRISLEMRCGDGKSPRLRAARQDLLDVKVA
jgi:hypothetical protein